jgi:ABC-2 type transport system ATP-binding protein
MTLWDEVRRLKDLGTTVFLTTQYLEEADQLADRIGIISQGRIVAEGTPAALKAEVGHPHLQLSFAGEVPDLDAAARVMAAYGPPEVVREHEMVRVALPDGAASIAAVVRSLDEAGLQVAALELVQPTLDDVFAAKTGRHLEGAGTAS